MTATQDNPTPLTDAECMDMSGRVTYRNVDAEFARTLERQLSQARRELESTRIEIQRVMGNSSEGWTEVLDRTIAQNHALKAELETERAKNAAVRDAAFGAAIHKIESRRLALYKEYGSTDQETGTVEFGRGPRGEYFTDLDGELAELSDAIRAMKGTP